MPPYWVREVVVTSIHVEGIMSDFRGLLHSEVCLPHSLQAEQVHKYVIIYNPLNNEQCNGGFE